MTNEKIPPSRVSMSISGGRLYPGGYSDEDIEAFAVEDGQAAVHNPSRFGENTHPHAIDIVNAGHDSNAGLIAYAYRDAVQTTSSELEFDVPKAKSAEQNAYAALEMWRRSQIGLMRLRHELESRGLPVPSARSMWWLIGGIVLLFGGETALISVGYQVFGLSDKPFIPLVSATDELHLAAYASVTALLIAAHVAGHKLRLISHDVEQRRLAVTDDAKAKLPKPSTFGGALIGVCIIGAGVILGGLSAIRADYLREQGVNAQSLPFVAIQVGIFAAAVFLSYTHAHPYGKQWAAQFREATNAEKTWKSAETILNDIVGAVNTNIDLCETLLAQAGHHVGISASDARRQASMYVRRTILSQPEPTLGRLFPSELPQPTTRSGLELGQYLVGITSVPVFEKFSTDGLAKRCEEIRAELRELDETLRAMRFSDEVAKELAELDAESR